MKKWRADRYRRGLDEALHRHPALRGLAAATVTGSQGALGTGATGPDQGEVQWPGEGSFRRCREYLQNGIALPLSLAEYLEKLARELGVVLPIQR